MPRKKIEAPATPAPVPVPAAAPAPASIPLSEPSNWSDLLGEISADADVRISVYREPDTGQGGAAFLFTVEAGDFQEFSDLLAHIKAHPDGGPGLYSLRAKKGTRFMGAPRVRIGGRRIEPPAAPAIATPPPVENKHTDFLERMVLALIAKPAAPSGGSSLGEIAQVFQMLNENRTPPPDPVDQLKKAFELKKLIAPEREPDDDVDDKTGRTMWDAIYSGIDTLGKAVAASPPPAPPAVHPNPAPAAIAPPPPRPAPPAGGNQSQALRLMFGILLQGAKMDSEPEAYAVLVLDQLGPQAPALLGHPNALATLEQFEPRIGQYREWFGQVIEAARELLKPEEPEAPGAGLTGTETGADGSAHVPGEPAAVP